MNLVGGSTKSSKCNFSNLQLHPWKINMENGGLVQIIFLSKWVICTFHVNIPGCTKHERATVHLPLRFSPNVGQIYVQLSDGWYGSQTHVFQYDSIGIGIRCSEECTSYSPRVFSSKDPDFFGKQQFQGGGVSLEGVKICRKPTRWAPDAVINGVITPINGRK